MISIEFQTQLIAFKMMAINVSDTHMHYLTPSLSILILL